MADSLVAAFERHGFQLTADGSTDKVQLLAKSLNVEPSRLADLYKSFASSRTSSASGEVSGPELNAFTEYAKEQHSKYSHGRAAQTSPLPTRLKPLLSPVLGDHTNLREHHTPLSDRKAGSKQGPLKKDPAGSRQPVVITSSLNEHLTFQDQSATAMEVDPLPVRELGPKADSQLLFMMDRLEDKVKCLEQRILRFAEAVEAAEGESLAHPIGIPSQAAQWHVGRICCDGDGRLDAASVLLEGSIEHSQGQRVRLDLSRVPTYRIFPGQIVAVFGVNPSGTQLVASRLITSVLPPVLRPPTAVEAKPIDAGAPRLSVVIAAGPYTMPDDLDYEPLHALLHYCSVHKPDLLLLLGPFVDAEQPCIKAGMVSRTFEDVFESSVIGPLQAAKGPKSIALVPSTRDIHHLPVFPQPAMSTSSDGKMVFLDNPSTFTVGGVTFGAITADVLRHLSSQELQSGSRDDRLAALASHILWQQSYYPLFPPATGTMLDTSLDERLQLPAMPHALLLPSDLISFAKLLPTTDSGDAVCVNPGRLTKGSSRGGFAHLRVAEEPAGTDAGEEAGIGKLCRVDLAKI